MRIRRLWWPAASFRSRNRRSRLQGEADPFDSFVWPGETDNPFERLSDREHREQLLVAFHAPSLGDLSPDEALVVGRFAAAGPDWGIRPVAVAGTEVAGVELPEVRWAPAPGREHEEAVLDWGGGSEWRSTLSALDVILRQLEYRTGREAPATARDVLAAHAIGAHIVVTGDRELIRVRDEAGLRMVNVLTALEAAVAIGVWARATRRGGTFSHWSSANFIYHWALTRAVTPAGWPAFAALVHGRRVFPDGARLEALAQSVFTRLDFLVEALDELYLSWQRDSTNPAIEEAAALLDSILLRGWAIQDNVALLVSLWFGLDVGRPTDASLHDARWRKAIRRTGDSGRAAIAALQPAAAPLAGLVDLRHHAVHRESLGALNFRDEDGSEQARLFVPAAISDVMRAGLLSAGQSPAAWGMADVRAPGVVQHSVDHGGGLIEEFEESSAGGVYLEPMLFAANFVAGVANVANTAFEALAPATDPRLPRPLRESAAAPATELWTTPRVARELLLTSPLSGLVLQPVGDHRGFRIPEPGAGGE